MQIIIDTDDFRRDCIHAETFALSDDGERALIRVLDLQDKINKFVEEVKSKIVENAKTIDADFTAISGRNVKLEYRASGAKYELKDHESVDATFVTTTMRDTPNTKAIDEYRKSHDGELPIGVEEKQRVKTLIIKRKGE